MPRARFSSARRLATAAAGALALLGLTTAPASAWQYTGTIGSAGAVESAPQIQVADLFVASAASLTLMTESGPVVRRSPATRGAQIVVVVYSVQRYDGAQWLLVTHQRSLARVPAGVQRMRLANAYLQPLQSRGYFRVQMVCGWFAAGNGAKLGSTVLTPDAAADHRCITRSRPCQASAGFVRLGRTIEAGGGW